MLNFYYYFVFDDCFLIHAQLDSLFYFTSITLFANLGLLWILLCFIDDCWLALIGLNCN